MMKYFLNPLQIVNKNLANSNSEFKISISSSDFQAGSLKMNSNRMTN